MTDNLTDMIYPIVIEKTLDNKLFDFQDLIDRSHSCSGSCGNHCSNRIKYGKTTWVDNESEF